jgi:hypothetical protein
MLKILLGVQFDDDRKLGKLLETTRPFPSGREKEKDDDRKRTDQDRK